jgi:hemerythrin-like domain-containing protein
LTWLKSLLGQVIRIKLTEIAIDHPLMPQEPTMTAVRPSASSAPAVGRPVEPFDVLDASHQQIVMALQQLATLVSHIQDQGADGRAQEMARAIMLFFSTTAREHHLDEERHVFPALLTSGDDQLVQHTLRLQQDHGWIEEDWLELAPQIEAIAAGYTWYNIDQLMHAIPVFTALYQDHIALEESIAYPEARARIATWDLHGMGREMAERRRLTGKAAA